MNPEALARLRNYLPTLKRLLFWSVLAAVAFHAAYAWKGASYLVVVYLFALLHLAQTERWREAAYSGLAVGLMLAVGRLAFFWRIFSGGAIGLWIVYAFWIALFVALARLCVRRFKPALAWALIPFIWTGLEYFRSELYYLRFSWLNPGYAFAEAPWVAPVRYVGMYGTGFLLMSVACVAAFLWRSSRRAQPRTDPGARPSPAAASLDWTQAMEGSEAGLLANVAAPGDGRAPNALRGCVRSRLQAVLALAGGVGLIAILGASFGAKSPASAGVVHIAGIQMEVPSEDDVLARLNDLVRKHPETELAVLSEYTFDDVIPPAITSWCKENQRYLVVGGKDPAPNANFYNTAFVIGPTGEVVFRQVKAVPIQFFKDGLPAPQQKLWASPWGKLGLCVCYDLSYTRVTDQLVRLGAQALIVPTMDALDWGQRQHELHARVAPTRAAEYGLPIFRLASSGISQWVDHRGRVCASAPCPGEGEVLAATLELPPAGRLPVDRWLGPLSTGLTLLLLLFFLIQKAIARCAPSRSSEVPVPTTPVRSEAERPKTPGSVPA